MGHLRKYLAWILAALCAFLPATALGVENHHTQITTTLPRAHTITVVCGEGGAVRVGETVYTGAQSFTAERLATFRLEAVPEAGQPLIIGHFALQIVETVEKIQPEGGADLVVAGADALQPLLIAGGLTEIQVPVTQLMF